jgi:hypothetical protein
MLDIEIRNDNVQDRTTGIRAHATDLREEEKERDDQGQLPISR